MFDDVSFDDLRQLFLRSLVTYQGIPVYIFDITERKELCFFKPPANAHNEVLRKHVSDKGFDFTPVPLGFSNVEGNAFYLSRQPIRQYRIGISNESLKVDALPGAKLEVHQRVTRVDGEGVANAVIGKYPSFEEAIFNLKNKVATSVAISRQFAINRDFQLFHKAKPVGLYDVKRADLLLMGSKEHIKILWDDYQNARNSDR